MCLFLLHAMWLEVNRAGRFSSGYDSFRRIIISLTICLFTCVQLVLLCFKFSNDPVPSGIPPGIASWISSGVFWATLLEDLWEILSGVSPFDFSFEIFFANTFNKKSILMYLQEFLQQYLYEFVNNFLWEFLQDVSSEITKKKSKNSFEKSTRFISGIPIGGYSVKVYSRSSIGNFSKNWIGNSCSSSVMNTSALLPGIHAGNPPWVYSGTLPEISSRISSFIIFPEVPSRTFPDDPWNVPPGLIFF